MDKKTVKHIGNLQQKKYRAEFHEFLVEGIKGVGEALASGADIVLIIAEGSRRGEPGIEGVLASAQKKGIPVEFAGRADISALKTTDTFAGLLAVVACADCAPDDIRDGSPVIALHSINDPGNLGTIIRTADWFDIKNILISENSVDAHNPKVVRSTMGSFFRVRIFEADNFAAELKKLESAGYGIVALDIAGKNISELKRKRKTVYLFGSESHGIPSALDELILERYTIPTNAQHEERAESLNIAVAAGILMSRL